MKIISPKHVLHRLGTVNDLHLGMGEGAANPGFRYTKPHAFFMKQESRHAFTLALSTQRVPRETHQPMFI